MLLLALALLQTAPAEPNETPRGPGLLCLKHSSFEMIEGEEVTYWTGGTESMSITIRGPGGWLALSESEIFVTPDVRGRLFESRGDDRVHSLGDDRYGFFEKTDAGLRMLVTARGSMLADRAKAGAVVARIRLGQKEPATCKRSYRYGWEYMFDDKEAAE